MQQQSLGSGPREIHRGSRERGLPPRGVGLQEQEALDQPDAVALPAVRVGVPKGAKARPDADTETGVIHDDTNGVFVSYTADRSDE
jgi:hypothetical protein